MAQSPPPFNPSSMAEAPRAAGSNQTCLIVALVVVGFCVVAGVAGFFFTKNLWSEVGQTASCFSAFELNQKAILAYAQEHDDRLPNAATWQKDTQVYYERLRKKFVSEGMPNEFMPPAPGEVFECGWQGGSTGIAFNSAVGGAKLSDIKDPTTTVLIFEVPEAKMNQSREFIESKKAAPKLFMNKRDWIVYYIEGERDPFESTDSSKADFEVTVEDALEPAQPKDTSAPGKK